MAVVITLSLKSATFRHSEPTAIIRADYGARHIGAKVSLGTSIRKMALSASIYNPTSTKIVFDRILLTESVSQSTFTRVKQQTVDANTTILIDINDVVFDGFEDYSIKGDILNMDGDGIIASSNTISSSGRSNILSEWKLSVVFELSDMTRISGTIGGSSSLVISPKTFISGSLFDLVSPEISAIDSGKIMIIMLCSSTAANATPSVIASVPITGILSEITAVSSPCPQWRLSSHYTLSQWRILVTKNIISPVSSRPTLLLNSPGHIINPLLIKLILTTDQGVSRTYTIADIQFSQLINQITTTNTDITSLESYAKIEFIIGVPQQSTAELIAILTTSYNGKTSKHVDKLLICPL